MQSRIVIRIVPWPLYRDTYHIMTLLVIHSTIINPNLQQHAEMEFETLHTCK